MKPQLKNSLNQVWRHFFTGQYLMACKRTYLPYLGYGQRQYSFSWFLNYCSYVYKNTGILCFSKVCLCPLTFLESPTLVPVFVTKINPKRIFTFVRKGKKQKQRSAFVLQRALIKAACTLSCESGTTKLLP